MICSYVRQTTNESPFYYLNDPEEFDVLPENYPCYKNIVFLINPNEDEMLFHVHSVGYEVSDPEKEIIDRTFPAYTIFHYVVGGKGSYNGASIGRGDCFISFKNQQHTLCSDHDDVLKFYWIMVKHPNSYSPSMFGLDQSREVFHYEFEREMEKIFSDMLYFKMGAQDVHSFYMSKFYELISYHRKTYSEQTKREGQHDYGNYVSLAKHMWERTQYSMSVEEVARSLGFSRKHFSLIFKNYTGKLPRLYILEHKIKLAKLSMETDSCVLSELSARLGYRDYTSFSYAFKRQTGMNPNEYLKKIKQENAQSGDYV